MIQWYFIYHFFFYHLLFLAFTFHDASSGRAHWIVHWWIGGDRQVPGYLGISLHGYAIDFTSVVVISLLLILFLSI